jgi:hypothetical protein
MLHLEFVRVVQAERERQIQQDRRARAALEAAAGARDVFVPAPHPGLGRPTHPPRLTVDLRRG